MAFTTADLAAVEKALAAGELSIGLGDMRIQYRSADELIRQRDIIRAELQSSGAITSVPRVSLTQRSRG